MSSQLSFVRCLLVGMSVLVLVACSRNSDNSNPTPFEQQVVERCGDLTPDVQLLNSLSLLADVDTLSSDTRISLNTAFDSGIRQYTAQTRELISTVNVFALPVLADSAQGILNVIMTVNGQEVVFGALSQSIPVALPSTEISVKVTATIDNRAVFDNCVPDSDATRNTVTVEQSYVVDLQVASLPAVDVPPRIAGARILSGSGLSETTQGQAVLDAGDRYGQSVALYDDILVVGAPFDDNGDQNRFGVTDVAALEAAERQTFLSGLHRNNTLTNSGAVYIFIRNQQGVWEFDHYLKAPVPDAQDQFGMAVAVYGNDLVISAPGEDSISEGINGQETNNTAPNSGAVYVYRRQSAQFSWSKVAYIKPPSNQPGVDGFDDAFGANVELNDKRLLVTAHKDDLIGDDIKADVGSVFLYTREDSGEWKLSQAIRQPSPQAGDEFGYDADLTSNRLIVGAPGERSNHRGLIQGAAIGSWFDPDANNFNLDNRDSGAAYVYNLANSGVTLSSYIKAPNSDAGDRFGASVAASHSRAQVFVGAPFEGGSGLGFNRDLETNTNPSSGAVYSYTGNQNGENWAIQNYIKAVSAPGAIEFGSSIAVEGRALFVGARSLNTRLTNSGTVANTQGAYFRLSSDLQGQAFKERWFVKDEFVSFEEQVGDAIAISNGRFVIGAPGANRALVDGVGTDLGVQSEVGRVVLFE